MARQEHYEAAHDSLQLLTEAQSICRCIELAMYEGSPDDTDVRYAIKGVARLLEKGIDISSMLDEEMRNDLAAAAETPVVPMPVKAKGGGR